MSVALPRDDSINSPAMPRRLSLWLAFPLLYVMLEILFGVTFWFSIPDRNWFGYYLRNLSLWIGAGLAVAGVACFAIDQIRLLLKPTIPPRGFDVILEVRKAKQPNQ